MMNMQTIKLRFPINMMTYTKAVIKKLIFRSISLITICHFSVYDMFGCVKYVICSDHILEYKFIL